MVQCAGLHAYDSIGRANVAATSACRAVYVVMQAICTPNRSLSDSVISPNLRDTAGSGGRTLTTLQVTL